MSVLLDAGCFAAGLYVGMHSGYKVVSWAQAEIAKIHAKLDVLVAKATTTIHPLRKL